MIHTPSPAADSRSSTLRAIHVPLSPCSAAGAGPPATRITNRDTMLGVSSAISVRLDDETLRALAQLEATGLSRSEAIRRAILDSAARLQRRAALAAEVAALEADEDDRREMLEVAAMMESMRAAG
jgi:predicted transcriptional regulator